MSTFDRCFGCMEEHPAPGPCPHCGRDEATAETHEIYLRPGCVLRDEFVVGRVLGHGGYGITYLGLQTTFDRKVAIKEFFPQGLVMRGGGRSEITVLPGDAEQYFADALAEFEAEGRQLARFHEHPGVVSVITRFSAHGTAYLVMEYLDGLSFKEYLEKRGGRVDFQTAHQVMMPVLDALRAVHAQQLFHRDIKPDNIFITRSGPVKLIDFGAAKMISSERTQTIGVTLTDGYAPPEQYEDRSRQGAWTDVYAVAATYYRALSGSTPPSSFMLRTGAATRRSLRELGLDLPGAAAEALERALALERDQRTPNIEALQNELLAATGGASPGREAGAGGTGSVPHEPTVRIPPPPDAERAGRSGPPLFKLAAGVVLALGLALGVAAFIEPDPDPVPPDPKPEPIEKPVPPDPTPEPIVRPVPPDPTPARIAKPAPPDPKPAPATPSTIHVSLRVRPGASKVEARGSDGAVHELSGRGQNWSGTLPAGGSYQLVIPASCLHKGATVRLPATADVERTIELKRRRLGPAEVDVRIDSATPPKLRFGKSIVAYTTKESPPGSGLFRTYPSLPRHSCERHDEDGPLGTPLPGPSDERFVATCCAPVAYTVLVGGKELARDTVVLPPDDMGRAEIRVP